MNRPHYYDRLGVPISLDEWGRLMGDRAYKTINGTVVGEVCVSTVWLGLDHNLFGTTPHIFETMVFENKITEGEFFDYPFRYHKALDELSKRYSTEAQAREGHARIVALLTELESSFDNQARKGDQDGEE